MITREFQLTNLNTKQKTSIGRYMLKYLTIINNMIIHCHAYSRLINGIKSICITIKNELSKDTKDTKEDINDVSCITWPKEGWLSGNSK